MPSSGEYRCNIKHLQEYNVNVADTCHVPNWPQMQDQNLPQC